MWKKLQRLGQMPFLNQLHALSNLYYRIKAAIFYRLFFRELGSGSCIRRPILILNPEFISIGKRVMIREGARLEAVRSSSERTPCLSIGDDTNIEQNVHIACHNRVRIGSKVSITANCSIVDVTHPFADVAEAQKIGGRIQDDDAFVEIGDGAFIGIGAVILPNVRIGQGAVIGANSVVTRDIPPYCTAAGAPAAVLRQYDFTRQQWIRVGVEMASPVA